MSVAPNTAQESAAASVPDCAQMSANDWAEIIKPYQQTTNFRAFVELAITLPSFLALMSFALFAVSAGYWFAVILVIPASGFLLRLFVLQHDCGHQSLFLQKWLNDWVGRALGVLTFTPYDYWLHNHAMHHAGCGNLDHRGVGDIDTLTVDEYLARSKFGQWVYRLYRNPITLFLIGPAYMFLLQHRLPIGMMTRGWRPWVSTMGTNIAIIAILAAIVWWAGLTALLLIVVPTTLISASVGVWLFFVQHQFEETVWDQTPDWQRKEAALHGSSHYVLPAVLRWFTGNIGVHHVHHLNAKIPFFQLPKILDENPELRDVNRITIRESLGTVKTVLWDRDQRKLITFSEVTKRT